MGNFNLTDLKGDYRAKWDKMVITPEREAGVTEAAKKVIAGKTRYLQLQTETSAPWYFIGILHYRESDCNFDRHLHNGDKLSARTVHVPQGRPRVGNPPFSFDESARDALQLEGFSGKSDWSLEVMAYRFEAYNGWGYRSHNCPSPYLWAGSNDYSRGKFVSDHVFDGSVVDPQMGTMVVLKKVAELESIDVIHAPMYVPLPTTVQLPAPAIEPAPISPKAKVDRPTNDQMNQVSRKHWLAHFWQIIFGGSSAAASGLGVLNTQQLEQTKAQMDFLKGFINDYGLWVVVGVLGGLVLFCGVLKKWMKDDVQEGRYTPSGEAKK